MCVGTLRWQPPHLPWLTGTHTGAPFFGVAPSGGPVTINGTAILRMRDGQVVEHWGGPHCSEGLGIAGARFDAA